MKDYIRQLLKSFFTLGKGEQRAIIILLSITLFLVVLNIFLPKMMEPSAEDHTVFSEQVKKFINRQTALADSAGIADLRNKGKLNDSLAKNFLHPFDFDPNGLPADQWLKLGLSPSQVEVIKNYESKGGVFREPEDLGKMYCLSDAEFRILEPYIRIKKHELPTKPKPVKGIENGDKIQKSVPPGYDTVNLNAADAPTLIKGLHFPSWLAKRVIKYRDLLGGFTGANQLSEVYGFDTTRIALLTQFIIIDTSMIQKINLNKCEFSDLLRHPYFDYELTTKIITSRESDGNFISIGDLPQRGLVSGKLFRKIKPYLTIGLPDSVQQVDK